MYFVIYLTISLIGTCSYAGDIESEVAQAFERFEITPDVVIEPPDDLISVTFTCGTKVDLGNELTPTQVKYQPSVSYTADPDSYYTLIFVDPDNYEGPETEYREMRHWLVGNIPGCNVMEGDVLVEYISSGPLQGTGLHRYTFTLFQQPHLLTFDEERIDNKTVEGRDGFSTEKFAEKYNLGAPVAGNFYRAQYDDYVPILYASLGMPIN